MTITATPAEANAAIESGRPVDLIDVRTPGEFEHEHARDARSIPLDNLNTASIASARKGSTEPVYVICQSGARAAKARERLSAAGVGPVFCVEGGTAAWVRAGLPVDRGGSKTISIERQVRIGAGSFMLLGIALAWAVHPALIAISVVVGAGLVFAGVTDTCGMGMLLGKMPWNRRESPRADLKS